MKRWFLISLVLIFVLLTGCGKQSLTPKQGSLLFTVDFRTLANGAHLATEDITIAKVSILLTRENYANITKDLTVTENVATGKIENLEPGYWHIKASVYDNTNILLFTGEADANVKAGVDTAVKILFDPVGAVDPVTGSISIEVGMNPLPGYKVLEQHIDKVLLNEIDNLLYIWDSSTNTIGVYDPDTFIRVRDYFLQQAPNAMNFNYEKTGMLLGYSSGQVYLLDFSTGQLSLIGDALIKVTHLVAFSPDYLLLDSSDGWDCELKSMNLTTGQIVSTRSYFNSIGDMIFNASTNTVYSYTIGVSPADIVYVKLNPTTGAILAATDSTYHGDYTYGSPLRIIKENSRVVTSSGNMFIAAELAENDLQYAGNLGYPYTDLFCDAALNSLYLLNSYDTWYDNDNEVRKMIIMDQSTFFVEKTIDLKGNPKHVFATPDSIIVITENAGSCYSKVFDKVQLGLK